jgi:hypothetical protein
MRREIKESHATPQMNFLQKQKELRERESAVSFSYIFQKSL